MKWETSIILFRMNVNFCLAKFIKFHILMVQNKAIILSQFLANLFINCFEVQTFQPLLMEYKLLTNFITNDTPLMYCRFYLYLYKTDPPKKNVFTV